MNLIALSVVDVLVDEGVRTYYDNNSLTYINPAYIETISSYNDSMLIHTTITLTNSKTLLVKEDIDYVLKEIAYAMNGYQ